MKVIILYDALASYWYVCKHIRHALATVLVIYIRAETVGKSMISEQPQNLTLLHKIVSLNNISYLKYAETDNFHTCIHFVHVYIYDH